MRISGMVSPPNTVDLDTHLLPAILTDNYRRVQYMRQPAQKLGGPIGTEKLGLLEDGVRGLFLLVAPVSTQPSPFGVVEAGNPVSVHHSCPKRRTDIAPRSSGEEDSRSLKPFRWNPAGNQSRPVEPDQQPEASLAWRVGDHPCEA